MAIKNLYIKSNRFFLGDVRKFSFEHRLLTAAILFSMLSFLLSSFLNLIIKISNNLTLETFVASLTLFAIYINSRFYKNFKSSLILLFVFINLILAANWFINAGSQGATLFGFLISIVFFLFITNQILTKILILIVNAALISTLFYIEYRFPNFIEFYHSSSERLLDMLITFYIIATLILSIGYSIKNGFKSQQIEKEKYLQQLLIEVEERKKIEIELQKEKKLFNNIFEYNPLSTALFDKNGYYIKGNKAGKLLFVQEPPTGYCLFEDMYIKTLGFDKRFMEMKEGKTVEFPEIWYNPSFHDKNAVDINVCLKTIFFPIINNDNEIEMFVQIHQNITESKIALEGLKESEQRFKDLANLLPETVYETNENGLLTFINKKGLESFGYCQQDFENGFHSLQIIAPEDREKAIKMREVTKDLKETTHVEYLAVRKDGSKVPVIIYTNPIFKQNVFVGTRGLIVNISDRKKIEANVIAALEEKKILLREVYHRVKNNLQHIYGLLKLQSNLIKDKKSLEVINECLIRVSAMSLVHEKLYKTENLTKICFKNYLEDLIENIKHAYNLKSTKIEFKLEIAEVYFNIDFCIPLGLISSEIISNSFKYAFNKVESGEIFITLKMSNTNEIELQISDDGCGLPSDFNLNSCSTLGLQLVSSLAKQINAQLEIFSQNGTSIRLKFKQIEN